MDSTHLMMTAEKMRDLGLTFASVHDSYWTHAADVDTLSRVLREQFVDLYSKDLLGRLKFDLEQMFPGVKFPEVPK